ncbi:MAG: 1,4-dihydroxy-2-naphthoyl-CoA hydrolase [Gammaproteobacteria bacterium]|jgi:1,4-dihydroxy-2-naphthoyl-CoA hydrolase|nr:hotdog fold thioesterase [Gammaproteobacteria bacterium]MEA3142381.1 1,4-dihydroxy-2-naphthoyl-CoA hydrolase [Gammaproteobacteria bacterium]
MSIWRSVQSIEQLNANGCGTLIENLGILFTQIGDDFVRGTMPVDTRTAQPYGLLHGGASVALAETLGSTGAAMCVDAADYQVVGQEINANHVRAARSGLVTGTARAVHVGGRTQVWSIDIVNESQKLVCISRITMAVIKRGALGS